MCANDVDISVFGQTYSFSNPQFDPSNPNSCSYENELNQKLVLTCEADIRIPENIRVLGWIYISEHKIYEIAMNGNEQVLQHEFVQIFEP